MPPSRAQRAKTAERRRQAIELRLAGVNWETIAAQLGYADKGSAHKDVTRALETSVAAMGQNAAVLRETELQRLDRIQRGLWAAAAGGDSKAADTVLRVIDRRIKLLGLDLPAGEDEAMRQQLAARLSGQMAVVFSRVLDALGLDEGQRAMVPDLLSDAIEAFGAQAKPLREIEGEVVP